MTYNINPLGVEVGGHPSHQFNDLRGHRRSHFPMWRILGGNRLLGTAKCFVWSGEVSYASTMHAMREKRRSHLSPFAALPR